MNRHYNYLINVRERMGSSLFRLSHLTSSFFCCCEGSSFRAGPSSVLKSPSFRALLQLKQVNFSTILPLFFGVTLLSTSFTAPPIDASVS